MSEYRETRKIIQAVPVGSPPVVETQHDAVVHERRGVSGAEVTALVLAAIAAAVVITMLIMNNQQRNRDEELAQERAAAAQQTPAQQAPTQPQAPAQQPQQPIVVMPQTPPATVPAPVPVPSQSTPAATPPSSAQLEVDITSKLMEDPELHSRPIDVKVNGTVATLSGQVPSEELKLRAERIARRVKGVRSVMNNIVVQP